MQAETQWWRMWWRTACRKTGRHQSGHSQRWGSSSCWVWTSEALGTSTLTWIIKDHVWSVELWDDCVYGLENWPSWKTKETNWEVADTGTSAWGRNLVWEREELLTLRAMLCLSAKLWPAPKEKTCVLRAPQTGLCYNPDGSCSHNENSWTHGRIRYRPLPSGWVLCSSMKASSLLHFPAMEGKFAGAQESRLLLDSTLIFSAGLRSPFTNPQSSKSLG